MGKSFSPVVAELFVQSFEESALQSSPFKPKLWIHYVDDTFVVQFGHSPYLPPTY